MLRCSEEAYAQCPDRKWCGSIEDAIFTAGSECDEFNHQVEFMGLTKMAMTNGELIRDMSDEELAEIFDGLGHACPRDMECTDQSCAACWLKWLQKPVDSDGL